MSDFKEIKTFGHLSFDQKRLDYYLNYFNKYYHDNFIPNQGTEVILDMLKEKGKEGIWLDIGAGPSTLFWSLMFSGIEELHCSEICAEGLKVLDDFMNSDIVPGCYRDIMARYNIPASHLEEMRKIPRRYYLFDALSIWPSQIKKDAYDMITAFGVFGLCISPAEYIKSFGHMRPFLKISGIALGANWARSQYFIDQGNTDNRYVSSALIEEAAKTYDYKIQHLSVENIENDPYYDKVVIWALSKK